MQSASYGNEGRPYTPSRAFTLTTLSQSPRIYPAKAGVPKANAQPPLPPKGIKNESDSNYTPAFCAQSDTRTGQWVFSLSQGSQSDYAAGDRSQSQEGGNLESYGYLQEPPSELSLSDSTQASVISEPTVKRSRYVCT